MSEQTDMPPHQQRVIDEKDQLADRLNKLNEFLSKGQPSFIDDAEWTRLNNQCVHMSNYLHVLSERIEHF